MANPLSPKELLARLVELESKATPGPWMTEDSVSYDGGIHRSIRTVDKLPEHPWSARYVVWLNGKLGEWRRSHEPKWQYCEVCKRGHYEGREVHVDIRHDEAIEADSEMIVLFRNQGREALRTVIRENERLVNVIDELLGATYVPRTFRGDDWEDAHISIWGGVLKFYEHEAPAAVALVRERAVKDA